LSFIPLLFTNLNIYPNTLQTNTAYEQLTSLKTLHTLPLRLQRTNHQTTTMSLFGAATRRLVACQAARFSARRTAVSVNVVQRSYSTSSVLSSNMDDLKSGTAAYMGLYPEKSTDGGKLTTLELIV
jgi:hypothetical protein